MSYTSTRPRQFQFILSFLNIELSGDPTTEEIALYSWLEDIAEICYEEAEGYCGQPLRSSSLTYEFDVLKSQKTLEDQYHWKFIPYFAGTTLTTVEKRDNLFDNYQVMSQNDFRWSTERYGNYLVFRNLDKGQIRTTLSTGFSDTTMPKTILQGIAEMTSIIYKQSPQGGNWFGLNSVSTGGAGQNVSSSLKTDIQWKRYFGTYVIPTV